MQQALALGSYCLALICLAVIGTLLLSALVSVAVRPGFLLARARALTLLEEWLSPEQRACYERFRYFDVVGSDTGTHYRIHYGTQTNIEELSHAGQRVCRWCFVPEGNLVAGDVMLAQKIALETNERVGATASVHGSLARYLDTRPDRQSVGALSRSAAARSLPASLKASERAEPGGRLRA
jgi:hypothetical protein